MVAATVIQFSTRGTVGSHNWQIQLIETSMLRSYHVQDYGWTPLSQNPCWKKRRYWAPLMCTSKYSLRAKIITLWQRVAFRKRRVIWCWKTISNIGRDKSSVYDLIKERGIVRMGVDLCHDLLRLSLCSWDLFTFLPPCNAPGSFDWVGLHVSYIVSRQKI